ncbi:SDR family oxidoreductase [Radicibacter daui]|uniref:SDR family oxidoreductase n=1 Tax=Radicibacter daui TaxID=3064829 RepID=UPI004046FBA7
MQMTGNTILITGGGSGIGKGLAEALHARGNQVIIAGRHQAVLEAVTAANPGMAALELDIADPASITRFASSVTEAYPDLNIVIQNAGIMRLEKAEDAAASLAVAEESITTNLLGPIRLTAALLPHLCTRPAATLMTVSSGLAFVPLAGTPSYGATKAAIHSWTMSMRHQLRNTPVEVIELVPPYVQTRLLTPGQENDPAAMPLADFIAETMGILESGPVEEVVVGRCRPLRFAAENGMTATMFAALANH